MGQFDWLVQERSVTRFTAFDTETTGLDAAAGRIIELGGISFDAAGIIARFNTLIQPGMPVPPEASRVNGITDAMLAGKPVFSDVAPDFLAFAAESVLVAHNAGFDMAFMNAELARNGLPSLPHRVVDTVLLAKEVFPGLPKYALQSLAARFGIVAVDAHRAEDDARVCMELFNLCVQTLADRLGLPQGQPAAEPGIQTVQTGQTPTSITAEIAPPSDEDIDEYEDYADSDEENWSDEEF